MDSLTVAVGLLNRYAGCVTVNADAALANPNHLGDVTMLTGETMKRIPYKKFLYNIWQFTGASLETES